MKKLLTFIAGFVTCFSVYAQQAIWGIPQIISPEIHQDNTVTFRLMAPEVESVQISGDFITPHKVDTPDGSYEVPVLVDMVKDEKGLWIYTTPEPLSPELYSYAFIVDGLRVNDPSNVYMIRDVGTVSSVFIIPGGRADLYRVNDVPHGTVSKVWYDSPGLDMKRRMTVYTPAGYDEGDTRYPVFYLLHGMGGDEEAWMDLGRASQILDNLIASGKAEPMIVVMTNGNASQEAAPGQTQYGLLAPTTALPRTKDGAFEEAFKDVVTYMDTHYRTLADKEHRAIAGLSMGGFHSLHISKYYPDMFDYVGLFSAAIFPPQNSLSPVYQDMEGGLSKQFADKPALYWIAIGKTDFLYEDNTSFRKLLDEKGYEYEYMETEGGHIWKNWRIYLSEFAPKLFK